jgi:hypothetical protein
MFNTLLNVAVAAQVWQQIAIPVGIGHPPTAKWKDTLAASTALLCIPKSS